MFSLASTIPRIREINEFVRLGKTSPENENTDEKNFIHPNSSKNIPSSMSSAVRNECLSTEAKKCKNVLLSTSLYRSEN